MAITRQLSASKHHLDHARKPAGGHSHRKISRHTVDDEYADFKKFIADINDPQKLVTTAKFSAGTSVDLNVLAKQIQAGKCKSIKKFDLSGVKFINVIPGDYTLKPLVTALASVDGNPNSRLLPTSLWLDLSNTNLTSADADIARIFSKFSGLTLKLDDNQIGDVGAKTFADALKALQARRSHKIALHLRNNGLTEAGLSTFIQAFSGSYFDFPDWSIELGNRRDSGVQKAATNKYSDAPSSPMFQAIKDPKVFPLFKGNTAIIKLDGCVLGQLIKKEYQQTFNTAKRDLPVRYTQTSVTGDAEPEPKLTASPSQLFLLAQMQKAKKEAEEKSYKPFAQIVQRIYGIPVQESEDGKIIYSPIGCEQVPFDDHNSGIYGTNLHADYIDGIDKTVPKTCNDCIIIGYTHRGLPFQVVVKGHDDTDLTQFIRLHVISLIANYADALTKSEDSDDVMRQLIAEIYDLQAQHAPGTNFGMAVGIMFAIDNELYCSGFGIAAARLVMVNPTTNKLVHVVWPGQKQMAEDAFNDESSKRQEEVIKRNRLFNRLIKRGYELIGCTELMDEMFNAEGKLDAAKLRPDFPTFLALQAANLDLYKKKHEGMQADKSSGQFGADSMVGGVAAPSKALQDFIKEFVKLGELQWEIEERIKTIESLQREMLAKKERGETISEQDAELYTKLHNERKIRILLNENVIALKKKIYTSKETTSGEKLPELTELLKDINNAIQFPTEASVTRLLLLAKEAEGSPSFAMQLIGGLLIVVGGLLALAGGVGMAASASALIAGFLPVAVPSLMVSGGILAGGVTLTCIGLGLLFGGRRQSGMSKDLDVVAEACNNLIPNP